MSWENHLIVAHERGTELYAFEHGGSIVAKPWQARDSLRASLGTPTVAGRWLLGHDRRGVVAVSLEDRLASCWREPRNERRKGMAHWVAQDDGERALLFCQSGWAFLVDLSGAEPAIIDQRQLTDATWSHPAVLETAILCRDRNTLYCYETLEG